MGRSLITTTQPSPYVTGMKRAIEDKAEIEFAISCYNAIFAGQSIQQAYEFGSSAIQLAGIPDDLIKSCFVPSSK